MCVSPSVSAAKSTFAPLNRASLFTFFGPSARPKMPQVTSVPFSEWPSGRRLHSPPVSTVSPTPRADCVWLHYSTFQSVRGLALGMVQRDGKSPAVWPYGSEALREGFRHPRQVSRSSLRFDNHAGLRSP